MSKSNERPMAKDGSSSPVAPKTYSGPQSGALPAGVPPPPTTGSSSWNGSQWAPTPTAPSAYNPNYAAPSQSAVGDYLSGTNGRGISASRGLSSLEGASLANTGQALSTQDFANYGGQIQGGADPSQIASSMGWNKPADAAWGTPAPSAFPETLAAGQRGPLARPVGMGQLRNNTMQMRGVPPPGMGDPKLNQTVALLRKGAQ